MPQQKLQKIFFLPKCLHLTQTTGEAVHSLKKISTALYSTSKFPQNVNIFENIIYILVFKVVFYTMIISD
jgi:hypothetical protein